MKKKVSNHNDNIRVAVRVRPPLENEMQNGNTFNSLKVDSKQKMINAFNQRTNMYKNASFDIVMD